MTTNCDIMEEEIYLSIHVMKNQKFKYNVINKLGKEETWSGIFDNAQKAEEWYEKHGKFHEQRGHKLVRRACSIR